MKYQKSERNKLIPNLSKFQPIVLLDQSFKLISFGVLMPLLQIQPTLIKRLTHFGKNLKF